MTLTVILLKYLMSGCTVLAVKRFWRILEHKYYRLKWFLILKSYCIYAFIFNEKSAINTLRTFHLFVSTFPF